MLRRSPDAVEVSAGCEGACQPVTCRTVLFRQGNDQLLQLLRSEVDVEQLDATHELVQVHVRWCSHSLKRSLSTRT